MENGDRTSEEIGEVAKEALEKLLSLMAVSGTVKPVQVEEDAEGASITLEVEGDDLGILIGRRGQVLASLQHIVRLIVSNQTNSHIPVIVDVEGYKRRRYEALRALARRIADQVGSRRLPFTLEPMTSFERRIIHLELADHPDVVTESTGVGDARKVVIMPKRR
ncbi:MAG: KH domain-containing protein [Chloroflexi bacterium]|nr:KH domain-containing protein [Chloroflexota bacterium]